MAEDICPEDRHRHLWIEGDPAGSACTIVLSTSCRLHMSGPWDVQIEDIIMSSAMAE